MRNLKKILALVLALVMSLSLMATASAADTTAANDAATLYKTAGDVLVGLNVVKGDAENPNDYRFNDPIIRAEAAALIYRVHTADVTDTKADLHDYTPFTDLAPVQTWATGYISYAHNAGIVKGNGNGTFSPLNNITGYEALAMTLRAMGYGKNGEFEGDQWRQTTASWAQRIGLFKGVSAADQTATRLDQPATRGLVFQIMFNAMLLDEVQFSALNPYNYESLGTTLGQRNFGLEEITGVIKANQWANLDADKVLAADTTKMTVSSVNPAKSAIAEVGKDITLDKATDLEAVGLTYIAYMANGAKANEKVVITDLVKSDINVDNNNDGEGVNTSLANQTYTSIEKLANGLSLTDAEYYLNYGEDMNGRAQSKWLIRYAVAKDSLKTAWADYLASDAIKSTVEPRTIYQTYLDTEIKDGESVVVEKAVKVDCLVRSIKPGNEITATDIQIMQEIFYTADRVGNTTVDNTGALLDYVVGEVYAGTTSMKDRSDDMAWVDFEAEFLTYDKVNKYESCNKGDSLRVIDNNGDGKAEYVLKVTYTQTKAVDTYKDELAFLGSLKMADYTGNNLYNPDELSSADLGVIANYTKIDGKLSIWKAEIVTDTIKAKSYKDITVTTTEGDETLDQSGIQNDTGLDQNIMSLPEKVTYNLYLDEYRNIRSFEPAEGKQYALLTELYYTGSQNWNYVTTDNVTVEAVLNGEETGPVAVDEYPNSSAGAFYSKDSKGQPNVWTSRWTRYSNSADLNFLQPATAHLGVEGNVFAGYTELGEPLYRNNIWSRNVFAPHDFDAGADINIHVFDYGNVAYDNPGTADAKYEAVTGVAGNSNASFSFTNVAKYVESDGSLTLSTASQVYQDQNGNKVYRATKDITVGGETVKQYETRTETQWKALYATEAAFDAAVANQDIYLVYATDYVQLRTDRVEPLMTSGGRHFTIDPNYSAKYNALSNSYVDTLNETVFYVVTPTKVYRQIGFSALMNFLSSVNVNVNNPGVVRAAYAVAQNTRKDANGQDYWVADVVVLEINAISHTYDSIALMYDNPDELTGNTQNVNSLDNEWRALQPDYDGKAQMTISPKSSGWANGPWGNSSYGFYGMIDETLVADGELTASSIERISYGNYNRNGIYAGVIRRNTDIQNSNYIDVEVVGRTYSPAGDTTHFTVKYDEWNTPIYRVVRNTFGHSSVKELYLTNFEPTNGVYDGDRVIVVQNGSGETAFVVDLGPNNLAKVGLKAVDYDIPTWLDQNWWMIAIEQVFTNGSTNAVDLANATIANLTGAVDDLNDAIVANSNVAALSVTNPDAAKLAWILLENGKGYNYRFKADTTQKDLIDLTVENIIDLVDGLTAVNWTPLNDDAEHAAVKAAIDSESLIKDIVQNREEGTTGEPIAPPVTEGAVPGSETSASVVTPDAGQVIDNLTGTENNTAVIQVDSSDTDAAVVNLAPAVVETLTSNETAKVTVESAQGTVSVPGEAIADAVDNAVDDPTAQVAIVVQEANLDGVTLDDVDTTNAVVADVSIYVGDENVSVSGLTNLISITLDAPAGMTDGDAVDVYYVSAGALVAVPGPHTVTNGKVTFEVDHLTTFALVPAEEPDTPVTPTTVNVTLTCDGATITVKPATGDAVTPDGNVYALTTGTAYTITVTPTDEAKTYTAATATGLTFTKQEDGTFTATLTPTEAKTYAITLTEEGGDTPDTPSALASLTVAVAEGTLTVTPAAGTDETRNYAVVAADPATTVSGWNTDTAFNATTLISGANFSETAPTTELAAGDSDKWVVVVDVKDNKLVAAGVTKIAAVVEPDPVDMVCAGTNNEELITNQLGITVSVDATEKIITYTYDKTALAAKLTEDLLTNSAIAHNDVLYCPIKFTVPASVKGVLCNSVEGSETSNVWSGPVEFTAGTGSADGTLVEWFRFATVSDSTATVLDGTTYTYTVKLYDKAVTDNTAPVDGTVLGTSEWTVKRVVTDSTTSE